MPDQMKTTKEKRLRLRKLCCGFCGKTEYEVLCLLEGPIASICDECVDLLGSMVAEKRSETKHAK